MIILGIDPGLATVGWGLIRKSEGQNGKGRNNLKYLVCSCIKTSPSLDFGKRLTIINAELNKLIKKYKPEVLAVEKLYFFRNLKTVMPVSQAEGVILFTAAKKKIPVYRFTPMQVKLAVTGYGWAEKKQVQKKIKTLLKVKELPSSDDAVDALAIAVCCAKTIAREA